MEYAYKLENPEKKGPWGGQDGTLWSYKPNRPIKKIIVRYVGIFNSIGFEIENEEGEVETSGRFGGTGGQKEEEIPIDWPREYLTGISGTRATVNGKYCVESICFLTNLDKHGPYGRTSGSHFEFSLRDTVIVGFFGRCSRIDFVYAIGVYIKSTADVFGPPRNTITTEVGSALMKNEEEENP